MDPKLKKILRGISLEIRRLLEGHYDDHGKWHAGDLEQRLNQMGLWRDRTAKPIEELRLSPEDKAARRLVDGYLKLREEAGVGREAAVSEFVRESAYTWANRLFALRCMEARGIIDEVILQKDAYGGRSLVHNRFGKKKPQACAGADDGLFAVLFEEFSQRAQELPVVFDPKSPAVVLRPSIAALKQAITLLSGSERARGQDAATDEVFAAPDAFGWAYQYWNADEKDRVFEMVRTLKDTKIQGADIIPATQLYTEPYMVKFLVQNSLGALWMGMHPESKLCEHWEYYVKDADRAPVRHKPVREITFLDPAQGSGHFHLEAFDLFYAMYAEEAALEGRTLAPREICAAILNQNLYGIDIDGRSLQIATAALWMKAKEQATELEAADLTSFHEHLMATNIRLPKGKDHLEFFLHKHPEDAPLRPALELVFRGLEHADELGALLQIDELVDAVFRRLKDEADKTKGTAVQTRLFESTLLQGPLPMSVEDYDKWRRDALNRLQAHFELEAQAAAPVQAFFSESAGKCLAFFDVLSRRYDVVAANPPYMGSNNMGPTLRAYVKDYVKKDAPGASRDLYGAFLVRGMSLCEPGGVMAFVTLESWCFKKAFSKLREKVVTSQTLESIVFLGRHAFTDADPPGLPVMSLVRNYTPSEGHRIWTLRLTTPRDAEDQARIVRDSAAGTIAQVSRTQQIALSQIPKFGFFTWLPEEILLCLRHNKRVGDLAECLAGLQTGDTPRFVRFIWETNRLAGRWMPFVQGGGIIKWCGLERAAVDWRVQGNLIRGYPGSCWRGTQYFKVEGLTYSESARGKLAMRVMRGSGFSQSGSGVFPRLGVNLMGLAAVLSSRLSSYSSRFLRPGRAFPVGYLSLIPVPSDVSALELEAKVAVRLKALLCQNNVLEYSYLTRGEMASSLIDSMKQTQLSEFAIAACLHSVEGMMEQMSFKLFNFSSDTIDAVIGETGKPAGWFPLLSQLDQIPQFPALGEVDAEVVSRSIEPRREKPGDSFGHAEFLGKLRVMFEAGPGVTEDDDGAGQETGIVSEEGEEDGDSESIAAVPIPAETFIEELSQKLEVHPISTYWLLKEGIERGGWRCPPEERRFTEDRFAVLVLRLLGHRWPKQLEANVPLPPWSDQAGVIRLTSGGGATPLVERVRERLTEDFPGGNVAAIEREFEEIVGVPLEQWLSSLFFQRHISQFKKRPIAWQIETDARGQRADGRKKKRGEAVKPVFACLIYYHKLDAGLFPTIRTHYVGILRGGYETELRTLERLPNPTAEQQGRKLQLDQWVEEMKAFDGKLEQVSLTGFGPPALRPALRQYAINDGLLSLTAAWLGRLNETVASGPLTKWLDAAAATKLHPEFPRWMKESLSHLDYFCAVLGPTPPAENTFTTDPASPDIAHLVCRDPKGMVRESIKLACARWWKPLDEAVLEPLRQGIKSVKEEIEKLDAELEMTGLAFQRRNELGERKHELKQKIKKLKGEHDEKSSRVKHLREEIEGWTCPEAETWEPWLSEKPLFDKVASLDGKRQPPQTLAEFITQESAYGPDINDGVRVNIAPVQKAGLLQADVLDSKDADKAIADRAEWRADERRWVREGKLPQPGWWESKKSTT
jgi:hypothetical protein